MYKQISKGNYKTKNEKGDCLILVIPVYTGAFTALGSLALSILNFPL